MTTDTLTLMTEIEDRIDQLSSLVESNMEDAVEVGAILSVLIKKTASIQEGFKGIIREEAVRRLNHAPGTVHIDGQDRGSVSVTVSTPKLQLVKDVDVGLLVKVLGEDFDHYFDTRIQYIPRKMVSDLIETMEDGTPKTVLLSSLYENEGTPRVFFKFN